ncbi:MAG: gamma-glutamyltransferase [Gemmatimonadales bacterium]|nr:gamma-glutamyltransferase [Gemmatimonadales bacterium]
MKNLLRPTLEKANVNSGISWLRPANLMTALLVAVVTAFPAGPWAEPVSTASIQPEKAILADRDIFHPVIAENGMVSSQQTLATEAGVAVLRQGGNAIDAAVTVGFTLAVTLPRAGNLGGGGFMLIHLGRDEQSGIDGKPGQTVAVDYRETAPLTAAKDMFLDETGQADTRESRYSYRAVGVPGTVAGLTMILQKYGTISLERALEPAIHLAENGFPVDRGLYESLIVVKKRMAASPASLEIFYPNEGMPPAIGELLIQKDLAWSLRQIAKHGAAAFYTGAIAEKLLSDMSAHQGLITARDLAGYQPVIREPVRGNYRGYEILSMPPPSSGGVHIIQMLNLLEPFPIAELGHNTAATIHLMAQSMKLAYADRAVHLGDPDFAPVPTRGMISRTYADELRALIDLKRDTPSARISAGRPLPHQLPAESNQTTHFSVMDNRGNAVANTYTLNLSFGTKMTAAGTGILLNNQMDDFSAKPGAPNAYGLIGGEFNAIAPGKRMLSSMSPTLVLHKGVPYLATGSPGGSRIITTTLQVLMNVIDHGMNIASATNAVRVHHQWQPDKLRIESGLGLDTIRLLEEMGYPIETRDAMGGTQSVLFQNGLFFGASDPRRTGGLTLGY